MARTSLRQRTDPSTKMLRSGFGSQVRSTASSEPAFGFGTSVRDAALRVSVWVEGLAEATGQHALKGSRRELQQQALRLVFCFVCLQPKWVVSAAQP